LRESDGIGPLCSSECKGRPSVKRSEPPSGCEVQQTHGSVAEETVEAVRNCEGGTSGRFGNRLPKQGLSGRCGSGRDERDVGGEVMRNPREENIFGCSARCGNTLKEKRRRRRLSHMISPDCIGQPSRKDLEGQPGNRPRPRRERQSPNELLPRRTDGTELTRFAC